MMKNLYEMKKRIYKLDGKRTGGKWSLIDRIGSHPFECDHSYSVIVDGEDGKDNETTICDDSRYYNIAPLKEDAAFIAIAPDMVDVIRAQDELLRECQKALAFHYDPSHDLLNNLKAALYENEK